jgi:peptidoglycan/xylan/chitin deacetylase (PgdA/CDA1 family)
MKKKIHFILPIIFGLIFLGVSISGQAAEVHRVKKGESLFEIARDYGVTTNELIWLNHLQDPGSIYHEQVLIVPEAEASHIYRIKMGDTLYKISRRLGIPIRVLVNNNNINKNNLLKPRKPLYIPYRYRHPKDYEVKSGDTLQKIADNFTVKLNELIILNNLDSPDNIAVGQKIRVPIVNESDYKGYNGPNYLKLFPDTFYLKGKSGKRRVSLTFDDGPDKIYTPKILDKLKKYNIKATFFLMGSRVIKHPEIVKRIIDEGHIIASHTWSHADLSKISEKRFEEEVNKTSGVLAEKTGRETQLLRPPYGAISIGVLQKLKEMSYKSIQWSVDSRDWLARDVNQILINTIPDVSNDAIILFHSAAGNKAHDLEATVKVLPELIRTLRMENYDFVNLDKLLGIKPYKKSS